MKLESRSPAIAVTATTNPIVAPSPIRRAHTDVATTETKSPRMLFDLPNSGRPSQRTRRSRRAAKQNGRRIFVLQPRRPVRDCRQSDELQKGPKMHY